MGLDRVADAIENIKRIVTHRQKLGRGVPLLVPTFVKLATNLGEMEAWYDQWLRALGCAVISGPSDCAVKMPDMAVADMAPPLRRPCARLDTRITVLSVGRIVSCEQDVTGRQVLGRVGEDRLADVWR